MIILRCCKNSQGDFGVVLWLEEPYVQPSEPTMHIFAVLEPVAGYKYTACSEGI